MSVPGSKMRDVDDDVGVHRAQRRQVEFLVRNDAAAGRGGALGLAAAGRRRADRRAQVGEQHARAAEPARQQRHLRPLVVGECAVEPARADARRLEHRLPDAAVLDQRAVGVERRRRRQRDAEHIADVAQRRPRELEPALEAGEVERIERRAVEVEPGPGDEGAQRQRLRLRVGAFGEEAEHAGGAEVDAYRQLPVLPDRLQAQAAFAGREAHAVGDLRMARCAAGADGDAAACRAARRTHRRRRGSGVARSRRGARRQARRSLAVASAALAEREARVDAGRQHLVDIEHVPVADGESPEGRQRRLLAIGLLFPLLAELPRGAAVGAALEVGVERRRLAGRRCAGAHRARHARGRGSRASGSRRGRAACAASGSTPARRSRSTRRGRGRCRAGRCERPRRAARRRRGRRGDRASLRAGAGSDRPGTASRSLRRGGSRRRARRRARSAPTANARRRATRRAEFSCG